MAASEPPDPRRLSSHEEAALARIERDLLDDDPTLVRLAADRPSRTTALRFPVPARDLAVLVVVLLGIVATATLLPPTAGWVLPIVTVLLVAPWTVLCARRATR